MTPVQINSAVQGYVAMRCAVAVAGKSPGAIINVQLSDTRGWSSAQVWRQIWPLFFYSGMKEKFAHPRANAAIAGRWFENFSVLATANHDQTHSWHVTEVQTNNGNGGGRAFRAVGADVQSFCSRSNIYATMPYRTGAKVVYRISELAAFFVRIDAAASRSRASFVDELSGGSALESNALDIAFASLRPVTGPITALHALSDLGFLCHKPDIWMCRIASWCGWTPGYSPSDLIKNRRDGWRVLREACLSIALEAVRQGLVTDPNPLRAFDWYVANYGMHFKPMNCPCSASLGEG